MKTMVLIMLALTSDVYAHPVSRTDAACGEVRESIHACVDASGNMTITAPDALCRRTDVRALHWTLGGPVIVFWKKDGGFENDCRPPIKNCH